MKICPCGVMHCGYTTYTSLIAPLKLSADLSLWKDFQVLFIYFPNTYININFINILYLMLDEFCA